MIINKDKHIGRVLFVVEGSRYEFNLLKQIFCIILQYDYVEKRRNRPNFFTSTHDSHSKVAVVNTKESNIGDITNNPKYLDEIYDLLREKYEFPVEQSAIYYLFDRDPKSNKDVSRIEEYIHMLRNPYENDVYFISGQLLLNYPSIESYTISSFCDDSFQIRSMLGIEAKNIIAQNPPIQVNRISSDTLLRATTEFMNYLAAENITWSIDDFTNASDRIFQKQEQDYIDNKGFRLFSMLTLAFLQMGIIELD